MALKIAVSVLLLASTALTSSTIRVQPGTPNWQQEDPLLADRRASAERLYAAPPGSIRVREGPFFAVDTRIEPPQSLAELMTKATCGAESVIIGRIAEITGFSGIEGRWLYTAHAVLVERRLHGTAPAVDDTIEYITTRGRRGGRWDSEGTGDDPLSEGGSYILFLRKDEERRATFGTARSQPHMDELRLGPVIRSTGPQRSFGLREGVDPITVTNAILNAACSAE